MIENEDTLRLACFLGALFIFGLAEAVFPRRGRVAARWRRWPTNLAMPIAASIPMQALIPGLAVGVAMAAEAHGWGLLNLVPLPYPVRFLTAFVLLDLLIYAQHVLFHYRPLFWRLHRVHHADRDLDASSALRFHPIEIWLSMAIKMGAVVLLGAPPEAVVLFEVVLNGCAIFNHANFHLPTWVDRWLRWLVVTPDMHRVHHSVIAAETNRNFGFNLPWWDRLFGTYTAQPKAGHRGMAIGLDTFPEAGNKGLVWALCNPFTSSSVRSNDNG